MGSDHNKIKKKSKYAEMFSSKQNYQNRLSEGFLGHNSKILNDLKQDNEINNTLIKSKTDRKLSENINKKEEEESFKKSRKETMDGLKSLSSQNLVKIDVKRNENEKENKEIEDIKEEKKIKNELYDDYENDNSIDEEEEEERKKEEEETEEEKKKKELMVSNNIKNVFIESRQKKKIKEENETENELIFEESKNKKENKPSNVITADDYELNFYRNGIDIRQSYLSKLLVKKVWTPNMKPKKHNCIIIFDWDDTLLPTSFLTKGGCFYEEIQLSPSDEKKIKELENLVLELLNETIEKGTVYIITNAGLEWVNFSSKRFYPKLIPILEKIKIISARGEYEKYYPGNSRQWKIEAFLKLQNTVNLGLITNIICLGDSLFEMEAGRILASKFTEAFIKTIKFRETPKLDELIKQLKLVVKQFNSIYSSIKNLTIRVERKKK